LFFPGLLFPIPQGRAQLARLFILWGDFESVDFFRTSLLPCGFSPLFFLCPFPCNTFEMDPGSVSVGAFLVLGPLVKLENPGPFSFPLPKHVLQVFPCVVRFFDLLCGLARAHMSPVLVPFFFVPQPLVRGFFPQSSLTHPPSPARGYSTNFFLFLFCDFPSPTP